MVNNNEIEKDIEISELNRDALSLKEINNSYITVKLNKYCNDNKLSLFEIETLKSFVVYLTN